MAKNMNLLDRLDEVRTNSVTPEEFEKAWGMSVEEYREKIRAFSKEQDAALAAEKEKVKSPSIVVITRPGIGKGRGGYRPGGIRAAKSTILKRNMAHNVGKQTLAVVLGKMGAGNRRANTEALIRRVKMILAKHEQGMDLTDMQKALLEKLGTIEMKDATALKRKRMGVIVDILDVDARSVGVRKASGPGRIGGAGGIASRRKGGKGRKGPRF